MPRSNTLSHLAQILLPAKYTDDQLQRALDSTGNDDVQRAAEILLLGIGSSKPTDLDGWLKPVRRKSDDEVGGKKRKRKVIKKAEEKDSCKRKSRSTSRGREEPIILSSSEDEPQVISHTKPLHPRAKPTTPEPDRKAKPDLKPEIDQSARSPTRLLTLETLLQPPTALRRNIARPPLTLTTPQAISTNLPCSLLPSPLSSAFASSLYLSLLDASKTELTKDEQGKVIREGFRRHEWYLNGRLVVSPHTSGYYRLTEEQGGVKDGGEYWYAGKKEHTPPGFPPLLRQAMDIINPFVNDILQPPPPESLDPDLTREWRIHARGGLDGPKRYKWEYGGEWKANVAAVNCYTGAESGVGWHADQLTHLGPYPTIVSLSLGTPRAFRLRPSADPNDPTLDVLGRPMRNYEVVLPHNSVLIMHAGCQELYKHCVAPLGKGKSLDIFRPGWTIEGDPVEPNDREKRNERINITFRFYRPDFHPVGEGRRKGTPVCRCGVPALLGADQKGKVKANMQKNGSSMTSGEVPNDVVDPAEDIKFFYRCQSTSATGDTKGCGFFQLMDCEKEGKGPLVGERR